MSDNDSTRGATHPYEHLLCQQAGFLPVPLSSTSYECLGDLSIYLLKNKTYTLYRRADLEFTREDLNRLIDSDVDLVYVSVQDHQLYFKTIENSLCDIVRDSNLRQERKAEIVYSTCIALVDQLYEEPPGQTEIHRVENVSHALVEMILGDQDSFKYLFEVSNHDFYTATHMVNVCTMMVSLGHQMGFDPQTLRHIGIGALLHDIGKLFVPSELLNTPRKLDAQQLSVLKRHVDLGRDYLEKVAQLDPISMAIVAEHHERLDGSGYPIQLEGDDITIYGRMAAVVDVYEAMTSVRPYRQRTFSFDEVLMWLEETNAKQYDMRVVEKFREMIETNLLRVESTEQDCLPKDKFIAKQYIKRMKRFYFRMPMDIRALERVGDQFVLGPSERMIVHNMSCSGIGLISPHPFAVDQNIYISIPCLESLQAAPFVAGVVHCRDHKDGWYTVGAKFHQLQPQSFIEHLKLFTIVTEELSIC